MIKTLVKIESIKEEKSLDKMEKKCVSHIEKSIIDVSFCSRKSSHPVHFPEKFFEEISGGVSLYSKEAFFIDISYGLEVVTMDAIRCIF